MESHIIKILICDALTTRDNLESNVDKSVKIKATSGKWVDLSVCHLINVTAGYKESKLWWDVRWWSLQSTSYLKKKLVTLV